ncbi:MAG: DUF2059 domain-containing protein [Candidatus Thiodiazotropha sp. (ex Monitilora ramsayi)]|nr:DUF2059 domain-containing protein [Candidatus Thiodiazotropha sp. (ex Monitilora ramsayi)]
MNKVVFLTLLLLALMSVQSYASDKQSLAIELLEITNAKKNHEIVVKTYVDNFQKSQEFKNTNIEKLLNEVVGWEVMKQPMIDVISSSYTEHELEELIKFMKSDVGRSFTKKSPIVNKQLVTIVSDNLKRAFVKLRDEQKLQSK